MYKKITNIEEVEHFLSKGIICLSQPVADEKYTFGYLTGSQYFAGVTSSPIDILKNEEINVPSKMLAGFYGEVFSIASLTAPNYSEYLKNIEFEDLSIDFNAAIYLIDGFDFVELNTEHEGTVSHPFVFIVDGEIVCVNEKGRDENNEWIVSNYKQEFFENLFEENEGYVILSESNGPIYISKEKYNLINELGAIDLSVLGIDVESPFDIIPVIQISLEGDIFDTIMLNTKEREPVHPTDESRFGYTDEDGDEYDSEGLSDEVFFNEESEFNWNNDDEEIDVVISEMNDNVADEGDWDQELSIELENDDELGDWDDEIDLEDEDK